MSSVAQARFLDLGTVPILVISMETVLMDGAIAFSGFMVMTVVNVSFVPLFSYLCSQCTEYMFASET